MSVYNERVKNFEKVRAYMREFYVYGFKSRSAYDEKSARSYDDERRRIESWLGDYMHFVRTSEGKNVFLSIDSRTTVHNPFYKALKAKSFTDGDITLHFILFDILHTPAVVLSLPQILEKIDKDYLCHFRAPMLFDASTVRKKLKEYTEEGIIVAEKSGRTVLYHRAEMQNLPFDADALHYFSEIAPCGAVGSFLLDKQKLHTERFCFKHHYITGALDSDVLAVSFAAMQQKCEVTAVNYTRRAATPQLVRIVPLRVFISVQNGRQYLLAYQAAGDSIKAYRLDYLAQMQLGAPCLQFDTLRARLDAAQPHMWGVNCRENENRLEHVEFTVFAGKNEAYIVNRLQREKRIGTVTKVDDTHYRFSADVYDTSELIPWIRTFICRITQLRFSNRTAENRFKHDIAEMYRMYGIEGGGAL